MSNQSLPSGYLKTALKNGVGRYVCQLKRCTIMFCKEHGSSQGVRDFMEKEFIDFARNNPSVAIYSQINRHRPPMVKAEYLNDKVHFIPLAKKSSEEVMQWMDWLRTRSGEDLYRLRKTQHTDSPSIQGTWTPYTNKSYEFAHITYPNSEHFKAHQFKESATEKVLQLADRQPET